MKINERAMLVNIGLNIAILSDKLDTVLGNVKNLGIRGAGGAVALLAVAVLAIALPILAVDCGIEFIKNKKEALDKRKQQSSVKPLDPTDASLTKMQIFCATLVNIIIMAGSVAVKGPFPKNCSTPNKMSSKCDLSPCLLDAV